MALRRIGTIDTDNLSGLEDIDRQIASFKSGERGQISIPLDRDIAIGEEYSNFSRGANSMNGELVSQGLRPWPGETKIVQLDWRNRMVYIKFAVTGYGGFSRTPYAAVGVLARLTTMAVGQFTKGAGRTAFQKLASATGTRIATSARTRAAKAALFRSARIAYKAGTRTGRLAGRVVLPRLGILVAGGAIIFFAMAVGKVITVFKETIIDPVVGLGRDVKEGVDKTTDWMKENMEKVAIGVVAGVLVIGGLMMARK
jgi:hypothetical protein|tara:strand:- start:1663 stop:2430 length:768 start_codon:yes stop_codon:yes gene_type:complete